jgi:cell cycle sensor histidine kinase DivJ
VSNHLKYLQNVWTTWASRIDGMIHPDAVSDPLTGPLHRSFLVGCFFSGAVALFVLPLHLALAGAPHSAAVLMLAWMLGQWPLALYLSRSGNLERAITISSVLFAVFTGVICALTGGAQSFAVIWLLIPCLEAAFAGQRRTAVITTGFCAAVYVGLFFLPAGGPIAFGLPAALDPVATLAAVLYAGLLACRLISDRSRTKTLIKNATEDFQTMGQAVSGVVCEVQSNGDMRLLGGPARRLFGPAFASNGPDWIFTRLHVTDRPAYLTRLSEARHDGLASELVLRVRRFHEHMEENGAPNFTAMTVRLIPAQAFRAGARDQCETQPVLVAIDPVTSETGGGAPVEILDNIEQLPEFTPDVSSESIPAQTARAKSA